MTQSSLSFWESLSHCLSLHKDSGICHPSYPSAKIQNVWLSSCLTERVRVGVCVILACGPSRCSQDTKDHNTKTQWHTHRTRMQKESAIKDSRNTFKHFIMLAMQVLRVCVCVLHVPAHVSGRLWGCVGGWMERSGRALASSCYHIRSHPNLSARPEREREREISLWSWTFTDYRAVTKISCHPPRLRKRHYR